MCKLINIVVLPVLFIICLNSHATELPAFPGAEGYGAISKGGRGGRVIKVTNLNPSGPGSLLEACMASGPRIVVFDVSGVIRGDIYITDSNITIAGQTAPRPGITIEGRLSTWSGDGKRFEDIQVRFLRLRQRPVNGIGGDVIQLSNSERVIIDHLSLAWGNDEMIDIIFSSEVTVQWSTIEESDDKGHRKGEGHNFGLLSAYPNSGNISIHHNLFAHHSRRLPSLSPGKASAPGDFRNNVIYDFSVGLHHDGHIPESPINVIGNYYIKGNSSDELLLLNLSEKGSYYFSENFIENYGSFDSQTVIQGKYPDWISAITNNATILIEEVPVAPVKTQNAKDAYELVLDNAGGFPRDRVTKRTIREVENHTGQWGRSEPGNLSDQWFMTGMEVETKNTDSDNDGIPDQWEVQRDLDPENGSDTNKLMKSGYTAIEEYLNERAEELLQSSQ